MMKYAKDLVRFALFRVPVDKFLKDLNFNKDFPFFLGLLFLGVLISVATLSIKMYFGPLPTLVNSDGTDFTLPILFIVFIFFGLFSSVVNYFLNCFAIHFLLTILKCKGNLSKTLGAIVKVLSSIQLTYSIPLQIIVLLISIVLLSFQENESFYSLSENIIMGFSLIASLIFIIISLYLSVKVVKKLYNTSTIKAVAAVLFLHIVVLIIMVVFLILMLMYFTARPA
ncbi:MAG: YIP1 family protein [archaeon]